MSPRLSTIALACSAILFSSGCVLGPESLRLSRTNYNRAVVDTAREEMLLNLVRMKYHQSEEFIGIPSITGQYQFDFDLGGSGNWQDSIATRLGLSLGAGATSKPTIVYTPEQDQEFNRRLLAPISLETIDLLTSKGWAFNRVLRLTVRNINDVDNATSAGGPTPELKPDFEEFVHVSNLLRELQEHGRQIEISYEEMATKDPVQLSDEISSDKVDGEAIILAAEKGYRFLHSADGTTASLWTRPGDEQVMVLRISPEIEDSSHVDEIRRILELDPEQLVYRIRSDNQGQLKQPNVRRLTGDNSNAKRDSLTVSPRSVKEMMFYLCHGINVPDSHVEKGFVRTTTDYSGVEFDWDELTGDLFRVHVQKLPPKDAAVAVRYQGHWFYIPECDLDSKSTFNLLLELFNLEIRAGGGAQIPLLTI